MAARPGIAAEEAVVVGEVRLVAASHDPEGRGDGASTDGEQGADGEQLGLGPGLCGEEWSEVGQDGYDVKWQVHGVSAPRMMARQSPSIVAVHPVDLLPQMAKVQSQHPGF